jgi:hypothetical protein
MMNTARPKRERGRSGFSDVGVAAGPQDVARAAHGLQPARVARVVLDLPAQPRDLDVDRALAPVDMGARDQLLARHGAVRLLGEGMEQRRLGGRQADMRALAHQLVAREVEGEGAEGYARRRHGRWRRAAQDRPDAQQQLVGLEGLGEVVVRAGGEAGDAIGRLGARGEQQHRQPRRRAQVPGQVEPGLAGHHHVDHRDVEGKGREARARLRGVGRGGHREAVAREELAQQLAQARVVVDDQDMRALAHGAARGRAQGALVEWNLVGCLAAVMALMDAAPSWRGRGGRLSLYRPARAPPQWAVRSAARIPAGGGGVVAGARLHPALAAIRLLQLPERGPRLQEVDQEGAGVEGGLAMGGGRGAEDDAVPRLEPAMPVHHQRPLERPAGMRLGGDALELALRHAREVLERHRADARVAMDVPDQPEEARHAADARPAARQGLELRADVEILALDLDQHVRRLGWHA